MYAAVSCRCEFKIELLAFYERLLEREERLIFINNIDSDRFGLVWFNFHFLKQRIHPECDAVYIREFYGAIFMFHKLVYARVLLSVPKLTRF